MQRMSYPGRRRWEAACAWIRRMPGKPGLARLITVRTTSLIVAVLLAGAALSFAVTALLVHEQVRSSLGHEAQLAAQRVKLEIDNAYQHIDALAQNPLVVNGLTDTAAGRTAYLEPLLQNDVLARQGAMLALLDFAGAPVSAALPAGQTVEVPPSTVADALRKGEPSAQLVRRQGRGAYQLQIIAPVKYEASGEPEGALVMRVDLAQLAPLTSAGQSGSMRFHVLLADAGGVLAGDQQRSTLFTVRHPVGLAGPIRERALFVEAGVETGSILRLLGLWLAAYAVFACIALFPVSIAARRMARGVTTPLVTLTGRVDGIRDSGRLDFAWDYAGDDEIGRLGRSFESMVQRVAEIKGELEFRVDTRTRELRQSKEQLAYLLRFAQSTLDGLTAHICVLDADGVILSVNRAWRDFAEANGGAPDRIGIGANYLAVCEAGAASGPGAKAAASGLRRVLRGEQTLFEMDYACGTSRQPRWFRMRVSRMADGVGGVVVAHEDVTVAKTVEAALQDRNDQLDTLLSSSPDGLVSIDGDGVVRFANTTFLRMTAIIPGAIVGQPEQRLDASLREICGDPAQFPGLSALCHSGAESADTPARHLLTLSDPRHSVLAITGVSSRAHSARKVFYFRDVTHEVEVDRMKSDFLATAAHELRTPMASVYGYTELLLSDDFDRATRRELLQTIYQQTDKLVNIINELLDLARIEARRGKDFRFGRVALAPLAERALAALAVDREAWPARVLGAADAPAAWGDPDKLYQAILNVLSNAVKYSPAGGEITVRIVAGDPAHPGQVGLTVRDRGVGMAPAHVARIFERFFRADSSGTIPGTGLGMAIVKEIIDLHRGEVVVHSELGKGTEIGIWLPVAGPFIPTVQIPETGAVRLLLDAAGR